MRKVVEGISTVGGSWFAEYNFSNGTYLKREFHKTIEGRITSVHAWVELDPWKNGIEIEEIKNL